jgi:hypothetical protein
MRLLGALVLSCLVPASAFADAGVTVVDDEPMSREVARAPSPPAADPPRAATPHAPADVGQLRSARVAAPDPVAVRSEAAVAREHDVAPPHAVDATATNGDMMAELAARQLSKEAKRHQRAIDGCLAAAHKRAPAAAGSLTLDFDVAARKVKSVAVSEDDVHDPQLASCLTNTARGFTFSLAAARFRWPVALR